MKEKSKRFIALLLILVIILPVQELRVFAETVSENEVTEEDGHNEQVTNPIEPKTVSGEETLPEADVTEKEFSHAGVNEERMPSAPIHHCAPDYTDFSYVYFGSYPQSEVIDNATIVAIDNAISTSGIVADAGVDVWIEGIKYRRISKSNTDYDVFFGDNDYRYFKWEKIKWKVLQNDGSTLFVVADMALDGKSYHDVYGKTTWEGSTIRKWLNESFYNTAFSSSEQAAIVEQTVVTADSRYTGTDGEIDTKDNVYLLSAGEVSNESYGFCGDYDAHPTSRRTQPSDFANARGVYRVTSSSDKGNCWWWLRSPSSSDGFAMDVDSNGDAGWSSNVSNIEGVCPALHINLSSGLWSVVDKGMEGEGTVLLNPVYHYSKDVTIWCYVYFGSYPQSEVTDTNIIADIEAKVSQQSFVNQSDIGADVLIDGTKYRRISKSNTNNIYFFGDNEYRYFKWEPIKWKVLCNNGETLFVVADKVLDCKNYNEEDAGITWEGCTLRSWLNESFYDTAFSSNEQDAIVAQTIVNEDNFYYGTEGGNDVEDNVYLLSIKEVTNSDYGFCNDYSIDSASKWVQGTPYACARGASIYNRSSTGKNNNCMWWLRSPGDYSHRAAYVDNYGYVNRDGTCVYYYYDYVGVCPALHINLQSDLWSIADDTVEEEKFLMGIQASKQKTTYEQGESLNVDDLKVTAYYQSHPEQVLPAGSYITNAAAINMNTPGSKTLTISYTEGAITKTAAITITVNPKADTAPKIKKGAKITDKDSAGTYKVTNTDSEAPTVEYTGTTNKNKKTIAIPEYVTYQGVKYKVTTVKAKSFKGNKKLTTIKIASSITKIGDNCFEGCTSLKTVTIGTGLKTIGKNAFKNCKNLKTLTIKSSKLKTVGKSAFKGVNAKCKIKVPAKKVKAYQKLMKKKGQKPTVKIGK